jgi:hypothetical protein
MENLTEEIYIKLAYDIVMNIQQITFSKMPTILKLLLEPP